MQISTTITESSMEIPQKAKDRTAMWSSDTAPGHLLKGTLNKDTTETPVYQCTALFLIAKVWKQPRCPTTNEWIKKMWYIYTMEFYTA
jgi:hypothetical protein